MEIESFMKRFQNVSGIRRSILALAATAVLFTSGCASRSYVGGGLANIGTNALPSFEKSVNFPRPYGIIYTNIRMPLTANFHDTHLPANPPSDGRTLEIREPLTGVGLYAQVDSNAIGDIARKHGLRKIYFADQQTFSILGIWAANKTILYGE